MGVTLKNFFSKPITVRYPMQIRNMHPRFRGAVGFVRDSETGRERCVGCGLCSAICPAQCLTVVPGIDQDGIRNAKIYLYDMSRCVFCGYCVEACPELALVMTHEFELAVDDRSKLVLDAEAMLALADRELERTGKEIEEPGFPAFDNAPSGFLKHKELPEKAQHGNYQIHQPYLGKLPHGYPMKWEEYLKKKEAGIPLAQGNLPPPVKDIQNQYLPDDEKKPMPKALEEFAQAAHQKRTKLITTAQTNDVYSHEVVDQDIDGKITPAYVEGGKNAKRFKKAWLAPSKDNQKDSANIGLPAPSDKDNAI